MIKYRPLVLEQLAKKLNFTEALMSLRVCWSSRSGNFAFSPISLIAFSTNSSIYLQYITVNLYCIGHYPV